jgi:hypothetical protein
VINFDPTKDSFNFDQSMFKNAAAVLGHAIDLNIAGQHEVLIAYTAPQGQPFEVDAMVLVGTTVHDLAKHTDLFHFV